MEAPSTATTPTITPTPSNFADVMSQRAASAESTGGLMQPASGLPPAKPQALQMPKSAQEWGDPPQKRAPLEQPSGTLDQENPLAEAPVEPQFDEEGNPVDVEAYQAQRQASLDAISAALEAGQFPYEQLKHLPIEFTVDGETQTATLDELRSNGMRAGKFSRSMAKAQGLAQQAQHVLQLERARTETWRQNPAELRKGMELMGCQEAFEHAAFAWAKERVEYMSLPPQQRALVDERRRLENDRAQWTDFQRRQQMIAQQNQGPDPVTVHVAKQIEQLMPRALRGAGVGVYPYSQQKFIENLQILCHEDGQVTPDRAQEAALATKEFLEDLARLQQNGGNGARPQSDNGSSGASTQYPLGPRRLAGSGGPRQQLMLGSITPGSGGSNGGQSNGQGRRPSDYAKRLGLG